MSGAYAEKRLLPADRAVKLPDGLDPKVAAAAFLKGLTVQCLVRRTFKVEKGQTILWHAAAGGVGSIAAQWVSALGATRDRHGRRRRKIEQRQGQWLRPRHQLPDRGFRRPGQGDHRRGGGGLRLRLGRQGHVPGVARLPPAARHVRVVRAVVRPAAALHAGDAAAEGVALRHPADGHRPTSPSGPTSMRRRRSCSRRCRTGR